MVNGRGGFASSKRIYTQIKRNEKAAIYERTVQKTGRFDGYEVFRIFVFLKGKKIFKKVYAEDTEHYPASSAFGKIAWYVTDLKKAEEILKNVKNSMGLNYFE